MEEENVGEVKKYDYFMLEYWNEDHTTYSKDYVEMHRKDEEFLSKFPEVTLLNHTSMFMVERNLVRKLKVKNLNDGLDESYKELVRLMCNVNRVRYMGNTSPMCGTTGSSGTDGSTGSSGTDGRMVGMVAEIKKEFRKIPPMPVIKPTIQPVVVLNNPFLELLEEMNV